MMAKTKEKIADFRAKTDKEIETLLGERRREQFNLRFQKATGQMSNTAQVGKVRKEIAKLMTITRERQIKTTKKA